MKFVALHLIIMLTVHNTALSRGENLPDQITAKQLRLGEDAMRAKLWEVAAHHYNILLAIPEQDETIRSQASIRLIEAMIRSGRPDEAFALMEQTHMQNHPEMPFWRGQALAASGRFISAVDTLKKLLSDSAFTNSVHRMEAGLTTASLELALGKSQEALKTLTLVAQDIEGAELQRIRLLQINILLDLERITEARELMPTGNEIAKSLQSEANFTEAAILLRESKAEDAATRYQDLVENPQNLSLRQYHEAWIGWSDSLLLQGKDVEAAELLLNYIQKHPESDLLEEIFKRLLAALPDEPITSDPILSRLQNWIMPTPLPSLGPIHHMDCRAVAAWPQPIESDDLTAFCLYTRAIGLHRMKSDESKHEANLLLKRLWLNFPTHFLSSRSLLVMADWRLDANRVEDAHQLFLTLRESATSPLVKGRAAFMQAYSIAGSGGSPADAAKLYYEAADLLQDTESDVASFNSNLIELIQTDVVAADDDDATINDPVIRASLELERALANDDPSVRLVAIEAFLLSHPNHPRAAEARINAAESAIIINPPDLSAAKAQIETLEVNPKNSDPVSPVRIALTKLRITDLAGTPEDTIRESRNLIDDFPTSKQAIEASFILGRNLFETANYNEALLTYQELPKKMSDTHRVQTAWLLAARSAALIPTSQSQKGSLKLFDNAIAIDGPLNSIAKLERARLMMDINMLEEAVEFLKPWHDELEESDPMHFASGLLMAEAVYAQGKLNPDSLPQALAIYDNLLIHTKRHTPDHDRLQYLRGLTLEQLPDPQVPDIKREKEALIAYYSVLEREKTPTQWEYFEASGFRALALLEKSLRWNAAIACARKIASFKGPRSKEAAARANQIQLKYMIWED